MTLTLIQHSRPDRILISNPGRKERRWKETGVSLRGYGVEYKREYYAATLWKRFKKVWREHIIGSAEAYLLSWWSGLLAFFLHGGLLVSGCLAITNCCAAASRRGRGATLGIVDRGKLWKPVWWAVLVLFGLGTSVYYYLVSHHLVSKTLDYMGEELFASDHLFLLASFDIV